MGLPFPAWVKKTVYEVETLWLACKEKVLGARVIIESDTDNHLENERTLTNDYLEKGLTVNSASLC